MDFQRRPRECTQPAIRAPEEKGDNGGSQVLPIVTEELPSSSDPTDSVSNSKEGKLLRFWEMDSSLAPARTLAVLLMLATVVLVCDRVPGGLLPALGLDRARQALLTTLGVHQEFPGERSSIGGMRKLGGTPSPEANRAKNGREGVALGGGLLSWPLIRLPWTRIPATEADVLKERAEDERLSRMCFEGRVDHSRDSERVETLRALMEPLARNGTVIVTPVNSGFLEMAFNLRCRLQALGSTNLLFWALDDGAFKQLSQRNISSYYDPTLYSAERAFEYQDSKYIRMMIERPRTWWRMLKTGFNVLFLDADMVAFDNPEKAFQQHADFEVQMDGWEGWDYVLKGGSGGTACGGAWWMRPSEKALNAMDRVALSYCRREEMFKNWHVNRWDDQIALNYILRDPEFAAMHGPGEKLNEARRPELLQVSFVSHTKILGGHLVTYGHVVGDGYSAKVQHKGLEGELLEVHPVLLHANGMGSLKKKTTALRRYKWWELNDQGMCRDPQHHVLSGGKGWGPWRFGWYTAY